MITQKERILLTLQHQGGITTLKAFQMGILCLHKRISELRADGYRISDTPIFVRNRYRQKCRVKLFWLTKK